MKKRLLSLLSLVLCLLLVLVPSPTALAEGDPAAATPGEESPLIDEEALNQWMEEYLKSHDLEHTWQDVSVGFCYTATGDCWFYNADVFMYSASLYKVPVSMLMSELEVAGDVTPETRIQGSTVEFLESTALIQSSNDSGHVMVSYLGGTYQGKCSDQSLIYTTLPEDYFSADFYEHSYYTARYMTQIMNTLYEGGEERFPHVIEYLLQAMPEEYLNLRLKGKYDVAQKYGAFVEKNGNNNNHIAAIVYTPTPVIITVMTRNVGDYQWRIAEIGEHLADYALELDQKLAEREALAAQTPEPTAAPEPSPAQTAVPASPTPDTAATPAPTADTSVAPDSPRGSALELLLLALGAAAVLALAVGLVRHAVVGSRRKEARRAVTTVTSDKSTYRPKH